MYFFSETLRITIPLAFLFILFPHSKSFAQKDSEPWHQQVTDEIQDVLDGYRIAMLSRDYETMLSFWSNSKDFVFAGDGRILGGFDAWKAETTRHYENTSSWEQWNWLNIHILPLSETSATATLEFRFRWKDQDNNTHNARGSWTYVFLKEKGAWKVVHTNGTHVGL